MKENEMVFGIRAVIEAIQADKEIDKILVKRELQGELSRELFEVLKGRDIPFYPFLFCLCLSCLYHGRGLSGCPVFYPYRTDHFPVWTVY